MPTPVPMSYHHQVMKAQVRRGGGVNLFRWIDPHQTWISGAHPHSTTNLLLIIQILFEHRHVGSAYPYTCALCGHIVDVVH